MSRRRPRSVYRAACGEKEDSVGKRYNFMAADLIPRYWDLTVETNEDIVFLGQVTIREMVRSWRYTARDLSWRIKSVDEKLQLLRGRGAAYIREIAQDYEHPLFAPEDIGTREGNWSGAPEPLDEASEKRESGATTFNICGWCKYAAGGTGRYGYHITTRCGFLVDADARNFERQFSTSCFLTRATDWVFDRLRSRLAGTLKQLVIKKRETDAKIRLLLKMEKQAEQKPALPNYRPHDWFNIGDPVACYIGEWERASIWGFLELILGQWSVLERLEDWVCAKIGEEPPRLGPAMRITYARWASAKVIDGYRHHDGCVSVRYDKRVHSGPYLNGRGGGYGMGRPEVMHAWEFEYLLEHPEFVDLFAKVGTSQHLSRYDSDQFIAALAREVFARK